ncbi:MAG TPA: hypothetical protein VJT31_08450, partial [Rugosimonospora sp.]|nr:hypothetical protein [Rugosimonospora sp.]
MSRIPVSIGGSMLRTALPSAREQRQTIEKEVLDGITPVHYKTNLPRLFGSGAPVMLGADQGVLTARPVGRPQILRRLKVYTEVVQESQAGLDKEEESNKGWGLRGIAGFRAGLATGSASGGGGWSKLSRGRADQYGRTAGLYRSLTDTKPAYLVRTAVINQVRMADGTIVPVPGVVSLFIDESHLHAADFSQFDDPDNLLPREQPPAAKPTRQPPRSLADGLFWGGVWTAPIGTGELRAGLEADAWELGGEDLAVQVQPLLNGLESKLPLLNDGGHLWPLYAGGEAYGLIMTAEAAGPPVHKGESAGAGLKMYTRSNTTTNIGQRTNKSVIVTLFSLGNSLTKKIYATLSGNSNLTRSVERRWQVGTNVLTMDGERPKGTAEFDVPIAWSYRLVHFPRTRDVKARMSEPRVREGTVVEPRTVHVPRDGSPFIGNPNLTWDGRLRNWLPKDLTVHGVQGLAGLDRAARNHRGSRWRALHPSEAKRLAARAEGTAGKRGGRGPTTETEAVLNRESLLTDLPTMLTPDGRTYAAVTTAAGQTTLPKGMNVRASFGKIHQIYYVKSAELEHYDHGTRTVSDSEVTTTRLDGTVQVEARVPIVPPADVGARVTVGGERSKAVDPGGSGMSTEHRSWLRRMMPAYHIDVDVTFLATTGSRWYSRPQIVHGRAEVVVTREDAERMGIPASVLDQAVNAQTAKPPTVDGAAGAATTTTANAAADTVATAAPNSANPAAAAPAADSTAVRPPRRTRLVEYLDAEPSDAKLLDAKLSEALASGVGDVQVRMVTDVPIPKVGVPLVPADAAGRRR